MQERSKWIEARSLLPHGDSDRRVIDFVPSGVDRMAIIQDTVLPVSRDMMPVAVLACGMLLGQNWPIVLR